MTGLAALVVLVWAYLLAGHGRFWQSGPSLDPARPDSSPSGPPPDLQHDDGEGDRDAAPPVEDLDQRGVPRVVVVLAVPGEALLGVEPLDEPVEVGDPGREPVELGERGVDLVTAGDTRGGAGVLERQGRSQGDEGEDGGGTHLDGVSLIWKD